tara:strand:+ start:288 stop:605 length:318 start_codon:yes stop_codon:yes gene_type:complete
LNHNQEPSHLPCPMCGKYEKNSFEVLSENRKLADQAYNNLKFLFLGFTLSYEMTELERKVFYYHKIKCEKFEHIAKILKKSQSTIYRAWKRCKLRGDKVLEESIY